MPDKSLKEIIEAASIYGSFASFWWLAFYLHMVRKGAKFNFFMMCVNVIISAWIWVTLYYILPADMWDVRIGLVSISGFLTYPIANFLEDKWLDLFINRFLWKQSK